MSASELKRCPFCGGEAKIQENGSYDRGYGYIVVCLDVKCAGNCGSGLLCFRTEDEAIAAWNRRAGEGEE